MDGTLAQILTELYRLSAENSMLQKRIQEIEGDLKRLGLEKRNNGKGAEIAAK